MFYHNKFSDLFVRLCGFCGNGFLGYGTWITRKPPLEGDSIRSPPIQLIRELPFSSSTNPGNVRLAKVSSVSVKSGVCCFFSLFLMERIRCRRSQIPEYCP